MASIFHGQVGTQTNWISKTDHAVWKCTLSGIVFLRAGKFIETENSTVLLVIVRLNKISLYFYGRGNENYVLDDLV